MRAGIAGVVTQGLDVLPGVLYGRRLVDECKGCLFMGGWELSRQCTPGRRLMDGFCVCVCVCVGGGGGGCLFMGRWVLSHQCLAVCARASARLWYVFVISPDCSCCSTSLHFTPRTARGTSTRGGQGRRKRPMKASSRSFCWKNAASSSSASASASLL